MQFSAEYSRITVSVCRTDLLQKTFFDADTLGVHRDEVLITRRSLEQREQTL